MLETVCRRSCWSTLLVVILFGFNTQTSSAGGTHNPGATSWAPVAGLRDQPTVLLDTDRVHDVFGNLAFVDGRLHVQRANRWHVLRLPDCREIGELPRLDGTNGGLVEHEGILYLFQARPTVVAPIGPDGKLGSLLRFDPCRDAALLPGVAFAFQTDSNPAGGGSTSCSLVVHEWTSGRKRWEAPIGKLALGRTVLTSSTAFVVSSDSPSVRVPARLCAFDLDSGVARWTAPAANLRSSGLAANDRHVVYQGPDFRLVVAEAGTGRRRATLDSLGPSTGTPEEGLERSATAGSMPGALNVHDVVLTDDTIVVHAADVAAYDAHTGACLWRKPCDSQYRAITGASDTLYVAERQTLAAVSLREGSELWRVSTERPILFLAAGDGRVACTIAGDRLLVLGRHGDAAAGTNIPRATITAKERWRCQAPDWDDEHFDRLFLTDAGVHFGNRRGGVVGHDRMTGRETWYLPAQRLTDLVAVTDSAIVFAPRGRDEATVRAFLVPSRTELPIPNPFKICQVGIIVRVTNSVLYNVVPTRSYDACLCSIDIGDGTIGWRAMLPGFHAYTFTDPNLIMAITTRNPSELAEKRPVDYRIASPNIIVDDVLYWMGDKDSVAAVNLVNRTVLWNATLTEPIHPPQDPASGRDRTLRIHHRAAYVASTVLRSSSPPLFVAATDEGRIAAFDATTGRRMWLTESLTDLGITGLATCRDRVYTVASDDTVTCLVGATGSPLWQSVLDGAVLAMVGDDNGLVITSRRGDVVNVVALEPFDHRNVQIASPSPRTGTSDGQSASLAERLQAAMPPGTEQTARKLLESWKTRRARTVEAPTDSQLAAYILLSGTVDDESLAGAILSATSEAASLGRVGNEGLLSALVHVTIHRLGSSDYVCVMGACACADVLVKSCVGIRSTPSEAALLKAITTATTATTAPHIRALALRVCSVPYSQNSAEAFIEASVTGLASAESPLQIIAARNILMTTNLFRHPTSEQNATLDKAVDTAFASSIPAVRNNALVIAERRFATRDRARLERLLQTAIDDAHPFVRAMALRSRFLPASALDAVRRHVDDPGSQDLPLPEYNSDGSILESAEMFPTIGKDYQRQTVGDVARATIQRMTSSK